jgi:hypothetical protein
MVLWMPRVLVILLCESVEIVKSLVVLVVLVHAGDACNGGGAGGY